MKHIFRIWVVLVLLGWSPWLRAAAGALPRSTAEEQGVSSTALLDFVNALDEKIDGMHSVMVLRHGKVIAEGWWTPYDATHNHVLYSLSKSFTSTAVGMAVADGKLSIDDEVLKFFPEAAPENPSNNLKAMRVRDLLTMSTGHQEEPSSAADTVSPKNFLSQPVPHLPGTHFKYNTAATFMQSAIVQKVTGQTVLEYLRPRLLQPLGISGAVWDTNYQGICLGGYGLRVRTEDIAKFGQLYLQKGVWDGQQLVPAEWVALATSKQTSNGSNPKSDWNQGYGFQFWRCQHNAYRGDGAFGQYCVVMPDQDAVLAITSGIKDMQAVLNLAWEKLLPAMQSQELKPDGAAAKALKEKLAHLEIRPAQGAASSSLAKKLIGRKIVFEENKQKLERVTISSPDGGKTLAVTLWTDGVNLTIPCGYHNWKRGRGPLMGGRLAQFPDEPVAGTFAWADENTCVIKYCAYETPFHTTLTLKVDGEQVTMDSEANVGFGPTKRPQVAGKMQ